MRILILHRNLPYPADNGGKLRAAYVADYLSQVSEVALLAFCEAGQGPLDDAKRAQFVECQMVMPSGGRGGWRRLVSSEPGDVWYLRSERMSALVAETVKRFDPQVIIAGDPSLTQYLEPYSDRVRVLDYVCVTTLQFQRLAGINSGVANLLWRLRERKYAAFHRKISQVYDCCWVNSAEDKADLERTAPAWHGISVVPNGLDLTQYPLDLAAKEENTLIYPGATTYPPNLDAVRWFVDEVLPRVRSAVPDVTMKVTGGYPTDGSAPQAPGVSYTGYVDDVKPVLSSASVCLVPLRAGGGGVRFKVLEAMALGVPMVSTAIGAEGVAYTHGKDILMAETAGEFADSVILLLQDKALRERIARAGRELVEQTYNWAKLGREIDETLKNLVAARLRQASN